MVVTCSIPDCQSNSKYVRLFPIPPPSEKNYDIGNKWIQSILHSYPNFSLDNVYHKYVCCKHFKYQYFIPPDTRLLKSFAIPTVFNIRHFAYVDIYRQPMNNNEADINTECGISANINYNFFTQGEDSVKVISVPNQSYNTIEPRPMPQNVFNHTLPSVHAKVQEPSEQTATSSRSLQPRKRRFECNYCN